MKLLIVNPAAGLGGGERQVLDQIAGLRAVDPSIACHLLTFEDGPLVALARAEGATVSVVSAGASLRSVGESSAMSARGAVRAIVGSADLLRRLGREVTRARPDVIQTAGMKAHVLVSLLPRRAPVLWFMQDLPSRRGVSRHLLRLLARRASGAICISQFVADDLGRVAPRMKRWVVLNGIDTEHFSPGSADPSFTAPPDATSVRVGLVATYARWKGQDLFMRAVAAARGRGAHVHGYIVGGPIYATAGSQWTRSELEAMARELGIERHVTFVPFAADPVGVYRSLDVVVHASTAPEPFGRTIAEAMACGKRVLAPAEGGPLEQIEDGASGTLYRPRDVDSLASAIAAAANNRPSDAASASDLARARLDRRRMAMELRGVYGEMVVRGLEGSTR